MTYRTAAIDLSRFQPKAALRGNLTAMELAELVGAQLAI